MSDKYTLIAAEYAANMAAPAADAPTLTKMCLWIGVSKSGFYDWKDRPLSATAVRQEYLKGKIEEIFGDNDETYGYRRVHAELARQGEQATREVVDNSRSIASVARGIGVGETTLGNWVRAYRDRHAGEDPPLEMSERARLREAEREVRELRQKVTFLEKVAAYFASEQQ